ncbi:AP-3 complex subunit delta-1-like isoform X2 [Acanthaster planci]|uniref:AP-3 complex subunit delta-1-like isoform X2 n=1 Tax=Acanthaster planci TaxID=133434 RepID=A0A8B7Y5K9_ACAPL|nr:AP-3 complex subunit delta-1-like isoform X2 [Acanthaster planci]
MALKKVKGSLERVFDKNLQDLVRGIRSNKDNEAKYIASCIDDIKQELRQENIAVKANAVSKLYYLQMLGYDISWAAFNIIEVMSSSKFTFKRIGYLAASQCFHEGTDVLMLTTNMIRKDLGSKQMYDTGCALSSLSCFLTSEMASDLANDIMGLMASTRPYIRKKAVLLMYKIFLKFPEALRPAFPRLKDKLEDPDPGVQSAAVNVICELARKNPKNYLSLAPLFFKLMTSSTNNWMLIKIIKLFGALTPLEPRLGKKLLEPLTNLIHSTSAMSLLYECINTVISVLISLSSGMPDHSASIQLCVQKLCILIEDSDQNLKYLGLLAMGKILKTHPKSVQSHKDLILDCLDDKDESIRLRALDLLYGMVSKKNLMEIVKKLMIHVDRAEGSQYRDELLAKIIQICSQNNYQYIVNFEWYVSILVELTRIEGTKHGHLIASQMLDVAIRVKAIRSFAVQQMAKLLENTSLLVGSAAQLNGICEVLYAAAWIVGEFSDFLLEPRLTLEAMLRQRVTSLPGHIQSIYVHNIIKLYSAILIKLEPDGDKEKITEVTQLITEKLPVFAESANLEVQERACCILQMLKYINKLQEKDVGVAEEVAALFAGELNPVAPKAQKKVPIPEGLDLDKWINEPPSESSDDEVTIDTMFVHDAHSGTSLRVSQKMRYEEPDEDELRRRREIRREEQASNPHYLKDNRKKKLKDLAAENDATVDGIPVAKIDLNVPLHVPGFNVTDVYMKKSKTSKKHKKKHRKGKRGRHASESSDDIQVAHKVDIVEEEMPEGATFSDDDEDQRPLDDPHRALDIDLDRPLDDQDKIPVREHRVVKAGLKTEVGQEATEIIEGEKPKKKHRKEKERNEKKSKKDKKHKKKSSEAAEEAPPTGEKEVDLMAGMEEEVAEESPETNGQVKDAAIPTDSVGAEAKPEVAKDDLTFWLTKADSATPTVSTVVEDAPEGVSESPADGKHKKHHKKEKKTRKEKEKKKKKRSHKGHHDEEEAEGDEIRTEEQMENGTPQENTPEIVIPQMSSYRLLAENSSIKMTYEIRVDQKMPNQVVVSVIFNNLTSAHVKSLDFNVLDSLNTRLIRGDSTSQHEGVKVPFQLPPGMANEGQFAFTVKSITMTQKLRGTLTYMLKDEAGATSEKIDFKVHLPVSAYLVPKQCSSTEYAELLSGGELTSKQSITTPNVEMDFSIILARACFFGHLSLVERVDTTASLYGLSIQGHHVCLLLKAMPNKSISVDGKSSDSSLLSSFLEEVKTFLTET